MPIEIRQLNIRTSVADLPSQSDISSDAVGQAMERQKREIVAELKVWLETRQFQQRER